ncbi:nuclear transport factor 2 family protein [Sphingomonas cavernae]|uniref:Nuclear transport factor 2 family protein n=1 Tax=Sphingomonas cavernae TaxID=2320861 RepID=A0A418WME2_9SPHN|nr:nuclear transport factor 2 family protein [Sphingomonas cavernae]RJF91168.1 nuclear transport factor 2 family protein [Sphingomonas cavernae]
MTDREAITDLIYRYCRAVDRLDHELGYSIWHEDGTADYGEAVYQGSVHGFVDFVCEQHGKTLGHSHQVTNIILTLDGDRAASESYHIAALRIMRGEQLHEICVRGRYLDRWSKRNGRWGIDHRVTIRDFDDIRPVTPLSNEVRSRRDRDDPSYAVLAIANEPGGRPR